MKHYFPEDLAEINVNLINPAGIDLQTSLMSVWAIVHVPTGKFLPESHGRYTQQEPCDPEQALPRLFDNPTTAKLARAQYIRGVHSLHRSGGGRGFFSDDDYEEYLEVSEAQHRIPEEYKVVDLSLGRVFP